MKIDMSQNFLGETGNPIDPCSLSVLSALMASCTFAPGLAPGNDLGIVYRMPKETWDYHLDNPMILEAALFRLGT